MWKSWRLTLHSEIDASPTGAESRIEGTIHSVNVSLRRNTPKAPSEDGALLVDQCGIEGDAHAGDWHRQVSFLALESIEKAQKLGLPVHEGSFGENFTIQGIDLLALPLGTQLQLGDEVLAEISQIGKVCHTRCAIYHIAGDCIFPRGGIFGVVLQGGTVKRGDPVGRVIKIGDGTCEYSPAEALEEVKAARMAGTL